MRLSEFSSGGLDELIILFRNQIQRANAEGSDAIFSWQAITNILKSSGHNFDYESFKTMYDSNPMLKSVVKNFDGDGVTLKTDTSIDDNGDKVDVDDEPTKTVQQMAKRATNRRS